MQCAVTIRGKWCNPAKAAIASGVLCMTFLTLTVRHRYQATVTSQKGRQTKAPTL